MSTFNFSMFLFLFRAICISCAENRPVANCPNTPATFEVSAYLNETILTSAIDLFSETYFYPDLDPLKNRSWFNPFSAGVNSTGYENKWFDGMHDGKYAGMKPAIISMKSVFNKEILVVTPSAGFYDLDPEVRIKCRQKNDLMRWYRGKKSFTVSRRPCVRWNTVNYQKQLDEWLALFDEQVDEMNNFCRNPDGMSCGPWCFIDVDMNREPCFLTCYKERYVETEPPCIHNVAWPYPTRSAASRNYLWNAYDPLFHGKGATGGDCAINYVENETKMMDVFFSQFMPFQYENVPLVGGKPQSVWGYGCYSTEEKITKVKFVSTYVKCDDLQIGCIPRNELLCYNYQGFRNRSVSGKPCVTWRRLLIERHSAKIEEFWRRILQNLSRVKSEQSKQNFDYKDGRNLLDNIFIEANDPNSRCVNVWNVVNVTTPGYTLPVDQYNDAFFKGPFCFVESSTDDFDYVPERCFLACEDLALDKLDCLPTDLPFSVSEYDGLKSTTSKNETCLKWADSASNVCRFDRDKNNIRCNTSAGSKRCFDKCSAKISFYNVMFKANYYSPCSEKRQEDQCCKSPLPIKTKTTATAVTSTSVGRRSVTTTEASTTSGTLLPFGTVSAPPDDSGDGLTDWAIAPITNAVFVLLATYAIGFVYLFAKREYYVKIYATDKTTRKAVAVGKGKKSTKTNA